MPDANPHSDYAYVRRVRNGVEVGCTTHSSLAAALDWLEKEAMLLSNAMVDVRMFDAGSGPFSGVEFEWCGEPWSYRISPREYSVGWAGGVE